MLNSLIAVALDTKGELIMEEHGMGGSYWSCHDLLIVDAFKLTLIDGVVIILDPRLIVAAVLAGCAKSGSIG